MENDYHKGKENTDKELIGTCHLKVKLAQENYVKHEVQ